jgi:hypothetical protein
MDPIAAVECFGTLNIKYDIQKEQLNEWKQRAIESNHDYDIRIKKVSKCICIVRGVSWHIMYL